MHPLRLNDLRSVLLYGPRQLPVSLWADLLGMDRTTLYYHIRQGNLKPVTILGKLHLDVQAVRKRFPEAFGHDEALQHTVGRQRQSCVVC